MSSYKRETKHPRTGEWENAFWVDDHFGNHRYGVFFDDGHIADPDLVKLETRDNSTPMTHPTPIEKDDWKEAIRDTLHNTKFNHGLAHSTIKKVCAALIATIEAEIALAYTQGEARSHFCQKPVENGTAICGCKLDCHIHDWRSPTKEHNETTV